MGPVNDRVREHMLRHKATSSTTFKWNTLADLSAVPRKKRGISCNVARSSARPRSANTWLGFEDKAPTPQQVDEMRDLVRKEMEAGALGIGTSLIYPPAFYAKTEELIELCKVAQNIRADTSRIMRSEGSRLLEALDELIRISRRRTSGRSLPHQGLRPRNWAKKREQLLAHIEQAAKGRAGNYRPTMYTYTAAGTGTRRVFATMTEKRRLYGAVQAAARSPRHTRED